MSSRNDRSLFSRTSTIAGRAARVMSPGRLSAFVGRAVGLGGSARAGLHDLDSLEARTLLDGDFNSAVVIALDGQGQGFADGTINPSVPSTNNDFFTFTAPADGFISVLADTRSISPASALNTRVTIYSDADHVTPITTGTNNGTLTTGVAKDGWAGFVAQSGQTYFVVVSNDGSTGNTALDYRVRINAQNVPFDLGTDDGIAREFGSPVPNPPLVPITPILGEITRLQQDLVYVYTVPAQSNFDSLVSVNAQATLYTGSGLSRRLDSRIDIYRQSASTGAVTLVASDSDAGRLNDAFTTMKVTPGQTYYIRIRSDEINPGREEPGTGSFFLVLDASAEVIDMNPVTRRGGVPAGAFTGFGDPSTPPSDNAPNPTFQTDLYRFKAQGSGLAIITGIPTGLFPVTDPALRLFDASGTLLAFNDNFAGASAQIEVQLVGGREYFIIIDGFEINSLIQYQLWIESNHTFQPTTPIDDHISTGELPPAADANDTANLLAQYRLLQKVTGLVWSDPFPTLDGDQNVVRDRGVRVQATAQGRIHAAGDTDLFQFTPPVDMLGGYGGDNDDNGTALFMGGRFDTADPGTPWPVGSRNLTLWDAADYWFTGAQFFDQNFGVTYGFNDNPDTPGTSGPEIYALLDYDPGVPPTGVPQGMTRRILVVGGDFDLIVPSPFGPVTFKNMAIWIQDWNTGVFGWDSIGDVDGPVRALTAYTPEENIPSRDDPAIEIPTNRPVVNNQAIAYLVAGGEFTDAGGTAANNIATFDAVNGWQAIGTGTNGPVFALTSYDPEDVGEERADSPGPPALPFVADSRDVPNSLFVGGQFTQFDGETVSNIAMWDGVDPDNVWMGPFDLPRTGAGPNGPVFALTTYLGWDPDDEAGEAEAVERVLVIGGDFTSIADGEGNNIAADNIAAWGFLGFFPGGNRDTQDPLYAPQGGWQEIGGGITAANANGDPVAVFALTQWDPPNINGNDIDPLLVIGGAFNAGLENIIAFNVNDAGAVPVQGTFGWLNNSDGFDAPVRALSIAIDEQEPGIATNLRPNAQIPQEVLYIGGDFTEVNNGLQVVAASRVVQYSAFRGLAADFFAFSRMANGVDFADPNATPPASVFALSTFDDGNPLEWDRHDRPATRVAIVVQPVEGSFLNTRVRVFDSTFRVFATGTPTGIVYGFDRPGSETIAPPFPDPSGMLDPSLTAPGAIGELGGIPVWGGETYYIEVSGAGTGRYTVSVIVDGLPLDLNGDGVLDDVNASMIEEPDAGQFDQALRINTQLASGDGNNFVAADTQPLHGNRARAQRIAPKTPSRIQQVGDLGVINTIDDTDLWTFRAEFTGTVEVRLTTTNLNFTNDDDDTNDGSAFAEQITDLSTGNAEFEPLRKVFSSHLDAVIRIFRNDFEQIGYQDSNTAIVGDFELAFIGTQDGEFDRRDPRLVFNVVAGNNYFIQVESGQKWKIGAPQDAADRTENIDREIDWRFATGAYELLVHQMPLLESDIDNGQEVRDDHINANGQLATVIPIGDDPADAATNGRGSILGTINNTPNNALDTDLFRFVAPATGTVTVTVTPLGALRPQLNVFDAGGNQVGTGTPLPGNAVTFTRAMTAGELLLLQVYGAGNSEGDYRIDISGLAVSDDHANNAKWAHSSDIPMLDFLGSGAINGRLEAAGDSDTFRFRVDAFLQLTMIVHPLDATLTPVVTVYEVSEDLSGNAIFLRIGRSTLVNGDARVIFPVSPDRRLDPPLADPAREYPYYYVLIEGANPLTNFGRYSLSTTFPPTDDHPDGDTDGDSTYDTGEYSFATEIAVDTNTGLGNNAGNLELASDSDLFFYTAPASGPSTITITRAAGSTLRLRVTVLDANANVLVTDAAADDALADTISVSLGVTRAARYWIVVDDETPNVNTTRTGAYTVNVIAPPIDDYANEGEFSLAGTIIISTTTGAGRIGGTQGGDPTNPVISPGGIDTDLFTFVTFLPGTYTITVTPFDTAAGNMLLRISLFDTSGGPVVDSADSPAQGQAATLTITGAPATRRYWVLVEAIAGGDPEGEYAIGVAGPVPQQPPDGDDPAAIDFNNPTPLPLDPRTGDGLRNDAIEVLNDRDLFTFTPTTSGRVFLDLLAPPGSLLRASIRVLSAPNENAGSTVVFDAEGIPGSISYVSFLATAGTQYWLIVDGLGDSVGTYTLRANTLPVTQQLYFPEGFTSDSIREFVSIINPNNVDAQYTVVLRYEFGQAETVIANGFIRANSRDGLTISDATFYRAPGVVAGVPYSIVLESTVPLGATLAHYDFGNSIGDSFTERLSARWDFARVERDPGNIRDFIVFYNPNNFGVTVTLTAYQTGGATASITRDFGALRRGGFALNDITHFPVGTFSVSLTARATSSANQGSFKGVVASQSHYDTGRDAGYAVLGDPDGGTREGVISNFAHGSTVASELVFFNSGDAPATINLTGSYIRAPLPQLNRVISVAPRSQAVISGSTLGVAADQPVGLSFTSDAPVSAQTFQIQLGDGDATTPATSASTRFYFGDAFIDVSKAGSLYFETLFFHNPTAVATTVTVRITFLDGIEDPTNTNPLRNRSFTVSLPARGYAEVRLHERAEILDRPVNNNWFAIDASAPVPIIASMTHYDLLLGGGWATNGVPFGLETPLTRIP